MRRRDWLVIAAILAAQAATSVAWAIVDAAAFAVLFAAGRALEAPR